MDYAVDLVRENNALKILLIKIATPFYALYEQSWVNGDLSDPLLSKPASPALVGGIRLCD